MILKKNVIFYLLSPPIKREILIRFVCVSHHFCKIVSKKMVDFWKYESINMSICGILYTNIVFSIWIWIKYLFGERMRK